MKIGIKGRDAIEATKELLAIEGLQGNYEVIEEKLFNEEQKKTIATIASIVSIASGTLNIAEKLYQWNQKYQNSLQDPAGARVEQVEIINNNRRLLLKKDINARQIQEFLED